MHSPFPDFIVAGAGRAGTTAITTALGGHPDIAVCRPKEPHFLAFGETSLNFAGPGDAITINSEAITDRARYAGLFTELRAELAGDGSTSSLYYHHAASDRLRALNPGARVIIMLRHPVDRAHSAFRYLRVRGFEPCESLEDAMECEDERVAADWHHLWHYRRMSMYADAVQTFFDRFGRDRVFVSFYEDMASDPSSVVADLLRFLDRDVARWDRTSVREVNVSGEPRSRFVQQAIQRAGRQPTLRRALKAAVPFALRERIRRANIVRSELPDSSRSALAKLFETDSVRLEEVLGRPLPYHVA